MFTPDPLFPKEIGIPARYRHQIDRCGIAIRAPVLETQKDFRALRANAENSFNLVIPDFQKT